MTTVAPYGTWASPLTPDVVARAGIRLGQLRSGGSALFWEELRPAEGGRTVVVRLDPDGSVSDVTPEGFNVRTQVHEYGGGAFAVHGTTVFFSNWTDQRLYRQDASGPPVPITPEPDAARALRYADADLTRDAATLVCVRERHGGADEAVNELVVLHTDGSREPTVAVGGHDFFSTPRISPDGRRLAWLAWDHPNMPWDGTRLYVADFDGTTVSGIEPVAGGDRESVFQPSWSPEGVLHSVSDATGWWNLYRIGGAGPEPVLVAEAEFGYPQWQFGMSAYAFLPDGRIACTWIESGRTIVGVISSGQAHVLDGSCVVQPSLTVHEGRIAVVAGAPDRTKAVVLIDPDDGRHEVVRHPAPLELDAGSVSPGEPISFPAPDGATAHAFLYRPRNADFEAPDGERPPLLVFSHGGPTGHSSNELDPRIQFWTTRGFAVVDVNYGGSTGYGRAYRERLEGQWGIVDVDDCVGAVRYLAERGEIDADRVAIRGGSAGGFTTLAALAFTDGVFKAGANYYGVSDLAALAADTHKFESRYLDSLVGPYPARKDLDEARSPLHHAERISCPVITFQGLEDAVVPPSQSERIFEALRGRGVPCAYVAYPGEQHGFRTAENIAHSLGAELAFYALVFGFEAAGPLPSVQVENL